MNREVYFMDNIITIRNLKKYYDEGATKALNGINLDIERGEFVSIIGPQEVENQHY
jgi:ABC-type phosphate/phosphonate transport system ATPase subunit